MKGRSSSGRENLVTPQQLKLPHSRNWWLQEQYSAGRSYAIPDSDQGKVLQNQIKAYRDYWTKEDHPKRQTEVLSAITVDKRVQRLLQFLGFLCMIKALEDPKRLTLSSCLSIDAIQGYCLWLTKGRDGSQGNIIEHLSAFISAVMFLYREVDGTAPSCNSLEIVAKLRQLRNQAAALQERTPKTIDDLTDNGKWIEWTAFEDAIDTLQKEFNEAKASDEAERPSNKTARLLHDLLLLRYYQAAPSRAGEVRLLQHIPFEDLTERRGKISVTQYAESKKINIISQRQPDMWTTWHADYKAFRSHGVDVTEFDAELFGNLNDALNQYLNGGYRQQLLKHGHAHDDHDDHDDHEYLFMNTKGAMFQSSTYSMYFSGLLQRISGCRTTSNVLRSSFVVHLMESNVDDATRSSAAALMKHSPQQQEKVYDRRTLSQRKSAAQRFIGKRGREPEGDEEPEPEEHEEHEEADPSPRKAARFNRSDLVVVPFVDAAGDSQFRFAKVIADDGSTITLVNLEPVGTADGYRANLKGISSQAPSQVFHVDAEFNRATGLYELLSTREEIIALL